MLSINPRPQLSDWKPAHETIEEMISVTSGERIAEVVAFFIKKTAIPKNHDKIVENWKATLSLQGLSDDDFGVVESVLAQKKVAEEKAAAKKEAIDEADRARALMAVIAAMQDGYEHTRFKAFTNLFGLAKQISQAQTSAELRAVLEILALLNK